LGAEVRVPMRWRLAIGLLTRLPAGALSRVAGRIADVTIPTPFRPAVLGAFARAIGADLAEAELPLGGYPTVDAFFTRRLRPGARPIAEDPGVVVSPVDALVGELGVLEDGRLLQVKGMSYSAASLLGEAAWAERFEGGPFVTLYLTPRHYHRIHAPSAGHVAAARHIPGALLPVNPPAVALVPELFPRNERVVCILEGHAAAIAVVAVGATNVGRISTAFDPEWNEPGGGVSNRRGAVATARSYAPPRSVAAGEELMAFHLGSTVVMLLEPGSARLLDRITPGLEVRYGEAIARSQ
jgi:phosphatidylserine decarboxylase